MKKINCLSLITARAGSKGLKNKNIKKINGKTLIEFKFKAISKARIKNNFITVSTDSNKYIKILKRNKINFIKRPASLAKDTSESKPVIMNSLDQLYKNGKKFDHVILLEPATPFSSFIDIKKAYKIFLEKKLDLIASVEETSVNSNFISPIKNKSLKLMLKKMSRIKKYRRQSFKKEFKMDGGFYIFRVKSLFKFKMLFDYRLKAEGYIVDKKRAINIEDLNDFNIAKCYYKEFSEISNSFK